MSDLMDVEEKNLITGKKAEDQLKIYSQQISSLSQKFASIPLLTALSVAAYFRDSHTPTHTNQALPIAEVHIDLLQSVLCGNHLTTSQEATGTREEAKSLLYAIKRLPQTFIYSRWTDNKKQETQRQRRARLHLETTVLRRNWGYLDDVNEISSELIQPLSGYLSQYLSLRVDLLPKVLDHLNQRSIDTMSMISKAFEEGQFNFANQEQAFIELLFQNTSKYTEDYLIITPHKLASTLKEPEQDICRLLDTISLTPGEHSCDLVHSLHSNPIWLKPFIKLECGKYFISSTHILSSNILDIYRSLASTKKHVMDKYDKRYQDYLEEKTFSLLSKQFNQTQIFKNCHIHGRKDLDGESDTILKIDSFLIIFEAKAHQFQAPAKRGTENNVNTYYKKAVSEGVKQANKSIRHVLESDNNAKFRSDGNIIEIDGDQSKDFIKIVIIYPDFGIISGNPFHYHDEKYIPERDNLVMSLVDLKIITEVLNTPAEFIDFLNNRKKINQKINVISDEMDFLGVYLENRLDNLLKKYQQADIFEAPKDCDAKIDQYKNEKIFQGIDNPPRHDISHLWDAIIRQAFQEELQGFVNFCLFLLRVPYDQQINEERQINEFSKQLRRQSNREKVYFTGRWLDGTKQGYLFIVYSGHLSNKKKAIINRQLALIQAGQELEVETIYTIKINTKSQKLYESFERVAVNTK